MITLALYAISTNLLLRILLIHQNILLKNCSGESLSGRISCDSVQFYSFMFWFVFDCALIYVLLCFAASA